MRVRHLAFQWFSGLGISPANNRKDGSCGSQRTRARMVPALSDDPWRVARRAAPAVPSGQKNRSEAVPRQNAITRRAVARPLLLCLGLGLGLAALPGAGAWAMPQWTSSPGLLHLAAHEAPMPQLTRRYATRVVAIGQPDADGNIYSVDVDITDMDPNEVRSWRITFFSGALYGYVYQVRTNDNDTLTVMSLDGPLNGVAKGDGLLIEEAPVNRPTPQKSGA